MASNSLAVSFAKELHRFEPKIAAALPAHLTSGRMIASCMSQINASNELQLCLQTEVGKQSVMQSIMVACVTGLEPGVLGSAYLIPYKNDRLKSHICTFVPGWKGIIDVVGRTGRALVRSGAVFEGDIFDYDVGTAMFVKHKPLSLTRNRTKLTHVYAIGEIAGLQDRIIEVWPIANIEEHFKRHNKVGEKHYAHKNWEMYARKVPVLQALKYVPKTVEITAVEAASYTAERNENLIVDEHGRPVNADYQDEGKEQKPPIKQPRQKGEAQDVQARQPADTNPPASPGQLAYLKRKAGGDMGLLKTAMKQAGVKSLDNLTLDGFNAIKEVLK